MIATGTAIAGIKCGTEILQEYKHHQEHQYECDHQCFPHLVDRCIQKFFGIVHGRSLYALGKVFRKIIQQLFNFCQDIIGIGTRCLKNGKTRNGFAIHPAIGRISDKNQILHGPHLSTEAWNHHCWL